MQELIKVIYDNDAPKVSGRELHAGLGIETPYHKWFPRMCEYGFSEQKDFWTKMSESTGGRPGTDHMLTLSMAKELCMIQRSEAGKMFRQYFIKVEEAWNTPEAVIQRANEYLNRKVAEQRASILQLTETVGIQNQRIAEMQPKVSYYDLILQSTSLVTIGQIAKDYGMSAKAMNAMLHDFGVQYRQGKTWLLYQKYAEQGYTHSKTYAVSDTQSKLLTCWTQKGRLFLYELLKKQGVLPIIEQEDDDYAIQTQTAMSLPRL